MIFFLPVCSCSFFLENLHLDNMQQNVSASKSSQTKDNCDVLSLGSPELRRQNKVKTTKSSKNYSLANENTEVYSQPLSVQHIPIETKVNTPFSFLIRPKVPPESPADFIKLDEHMVQLALQYRAPGLSETDQARYVPQLVDTITHLYCFYGNKVRREDDDISLQVYMTALIDYITFILTVPSDGSKERNQDKRERRQLKNFFSLRIADAQSQILELARLEQKQQLRYRPIDKDGKELPSKVEKVVNRLQRIKDQQTKENKSQKTKNGQNLQSVSLMQPQTIYSQSQPSQHVVQTDDDVQMAMICGQTSGLRIEQPQMTEEEEEKTAVDVDMEDDNEDDDNDPELNEYEPEDGDSEDEYSSDELENEGDEDDDDDDDGDDDDGES